ncbi:MAG: methylamine utilization protein [Pelomonas sp.]|nr:methylamine utilization protein [Burkholderiaceae bacterium]MBV8604571.1 methylamine utilization protein [Roseateles sp.]
MQALCADLTVQVHDAKGAPVEDAVVFAEPLAGATSQKTAHTAEIAQLKRTFIPLVTVVRVGTEISFPNNDPFKHHVYSFSPAKTFDLPLYSGKSAPPQLFDKVGTVVLGCNIHDKMIAYVQVVDTPYFGKTDAQGTVRLEGLPNGKYELKTWYYGLPSRKQTLSQPLVMQDAESTASFSLDVVRTLPPPLPGH